MTVLTRRATLGGLAAGALARPALAQGGSGTVRFIPHADLSALDPVWTTAYIVRNHGYMVFDTLYATDSAFRVRPQMAEGHVVEDGGLSWTITLRPSLRFHDGEPVRAADAVVRRRTILDGRCARRAFAMRRSGRKDGPDRTKGWGGDALATPG